MKNYNVLSQKIKETLDSFIKGDRLRVAVVETEQGLMLKVALMDWGGFETAFFTDSRYLAIPRKVCAKDISKLNIELPCYYGNDCVLSNYTKGVFEHFALYDTQKIWCELGYTPINTNLTQFRNKLAEELKSI